MKILLLSTAILLSACASKPVKDEQVLTKVPNGRIHERDDGEFTVRTAAGTEIEMEFNRKGELESASGENANEGDYFDPGMGLLSLDRLSAEMSKQGHTIKGDWELEKDDDDWIYEVDGEFRGDGMTYKVDAKTAEILDANG